MRDSACITLEMFHNRLFCIFITLLHTNRCGAVIPSLFNIAGLMSYTFSMAYISLLGGLWGQLMTELVGGCLGHMTEAIQHLLLFIRLTREDALSVNTVGLYAHFNLLEIHATTKYFIL